MCGRRGLLADSDDQVFEVAVSRAFREKYNTILQPILAEVQYDCSLLNAELVSNVCMTCRELKYSLLEGRVGMEALFLALQ